MRRLTVSLLLLPVLCVNTAAFRVGQARAPSPTSNSAGEPEFESLGVQGNVALYNLEYEKASKAFEQMTRLAADHPAGYFYLGNNLWLERLNRSRRLSSSLYSSGSFYSDTAETVDQVHEEKFKAAINKALAVAESRLKRDPKDVTSLYYKGAALGIRAAYKVTVNRSYRTAFGDANASVGIHKRVVKLDPDFTDANLSIGFYDYVVGNLPFGLRFLARLVGIKGSKASGIALLEKVAEHGKHASDDARVLLIGIYARERKYEKALAVLGYLSGKYPRNYLFGIERAAMLYRLGRTEEGARAFSELRNDDHIAADAKDVVNYQFGEALTEARNYASAVEAYKAVIDWPGSDKGLVTLAHLRAGQALDALGKRADAVKEYNWVLQHPNVYDSQAVANKYKKNAYAPIKR
ncbi:MAG TPA: hypothetical protein VLM38_19845 [Blastocatellia bacterium]|nr:hypothetical protein [Blastocatellia bacterium]